MTFSPDPESTTSVSDVGEKSERSPPVTKDAEWPKTIVQSEQLVAKHLNFVATRFKWTYGGLGKI